MDSSPKKANNEKAIPLQVDIPSNPFKHDLLVKEYEEDVESMTCPICSTLVWNAVHCSVCTNLICKKCIDNWLLKSKKCPMCNQEFKPNNIVNLVKNQLGKIKHRCYFNESAAGAACEQLIPYFDYENHIKNCDYYPHKCGFTSCQEVGPKVKILEHYESCEYNEDSCPFCKSKMKKRLLGMHLELCEFKEIICVRCQIPIKQRFYPKHAKDANECILALKDKQANDINALQEELKTLKLQLSSSPNKDTYDQLKNENIQLVNKANINEDKFNTFKSKYQQEVLKFQTENEKSRMIIQRLQEKCDQLSNELSNVSKDLQKEKCVSQNYANQINSLKAQQQQQQSNTSIPFGNQQYNKIFNQIFGGKK